MRHCETCKHFDKAASFGTTPRGFHFGSCTYEVTDAAESVAYRYLPTSIVLERQGVTGEEGVDCQVWAAS